MTSLAVINLVTAVTIQVCLLCFIDFRFRSAAAVVLRHGGWACLSFKELLAFILPPTFIDHVPGRRNSPGSGFNTYPLVHV